MQRRTLLRASPALAALALLPTLGTTQTSPSTPSTPALPVLQVWKDPNCGCCKDWIAHLEKNGFSTMVIEQGNSAARAHLGMPQKFGSCHTALIQGYVIEGHVPAADIQRLLKEKPKALGDSEADYAENRRADFNYKR